MPFCSRDRLLVFAPHPDDETIAAGALLQTAAAAGATVRIVFATNGDNNPWPQRWLERRWRIDRQARERWGRRRQQEAGTALGVLGLGDRSTVRFLGWPDQGLTTCLMLRPAAVDVLRAELDGFEPSHVVLPTLADDHPDHSALRILVDLALLASPRQVARLGYTVHGRDEGERISVGADDDAMCARKLRALAAYRSQTALSGRRLQAMATRVETFTCAGTPVAPGAEASGFSLALPGGMPTGGGYDLLIVAASSAGIERLRCRLPRLLRRGALPCLATRDGEVRLHAGRGELVVSLPAPTAPLLALWAKLHRREPRLVVFDRRHWQDARALCGTCPIPPGGAPAPAGVERAPA